MSIKMSFEDHFKSTNIEQLLNGYYTPITDVKETKDFILVDVELPGVNNHNITIEIGDGVLDIRGEHIEEEEHRGLPTHSIRKERIFGKFKKTVPIQYDIASSDIKASFTNGLLSLEIPKPKQKMSQKKQKVRLL